MKRGSPEAGELVVCRILVIRPNSADAELLEYGIRGMIHVSEVAGRWVRDIREFLKESQYVVCRVLSGGQQPGLSMKRVRPDESQRKMNEFKRERKAGNLLEQVAKSLGKTREQAFQDVGFMLQEEFGSLTKAFEIAAKRPDLLKAKSIPPAWEKALVEAAQKKLAERTYTLKGELRLLSYRPDGVEIIRRHLLAAQRRGLTIAYLSAPRYLLAAEGKDPKKLRATLEEEGWAIVKAVEKDGGEGAFTVKE